MGCCFSGEEKEDTACEPGFIELSDTQKGPNVVVTGANISGAGSVLGDAPVLQDKGYFECRVGSAGHFSIGVATKGVSLDGLLKDGMPAWMLTHEHENAPAPGDVVGVAIDQADYPVQLYFYCNARLIHQMSGIRGEVLPAFSVGDGATLDANFGRKEPWGGAIPAGFEGLIKSMSLL